MADSLLPVISKIVPTTDWNKPDAVDKLKSCPVENAILYVYVDRQSANSYVVGMYNNNTLSKPVMNTRPICIVNIITTMGRILGIVMFHTLCQRLAPSIHAASYRFWSMPDIVAM